MVKYTRSPSSDGFGDGIEKDFGNFNSSGLMKES
jgi:hypothetical protein